MLSKKLTLAMGQKHQLLTMIEKTNIQNNLGSIENKEQNLKNIEKISESQKVQERQMQEIREQVKSVGNAISEGISQEKMREVENKEREKEIQRNNKEKEMNEYVSSIKSEKRAKQQEVSNLEAEVGRQQLALQNSKDTLQKQVKYQSDVLAQKDKQFSETMTDKERQLQDLMKQLADLKNKCKEEKRRHDEIEDAEDEMECTRERLMAELDRLDEEIDEIEDDYEDQDLLIQKLQMESLELQNNLAKVDEDMKLQYQELEDLKLDNQELDDDVQGIIKQCKILEDDEFDLDQIQKSLQDAMDQEKLLFEANLGLMQELKQVEMQKQESGQKNIEMEALINMLTEHNFVERRSRIVEKMIRELEDKLWEKRSIALDIQRKIVRINDLIGNQGAEYLKGFGCDTLKEKLDKFEVDITEFEREKEVMRQKKKKIDVIVVGKDIKDITDDQIKKCLGGLREIEKDIDISMQKENDVLIIERLKKQFQDIERDIGSDYFKKAKLLKETQEKRQDQFIKKANTLLSKAKQIEDEVLPDVSKIADDEDEIEILKGKIEILKELKRSTQDIVAIDIEQNSNAKLQKVVFRREDTYDTIEQYFGVVDIELDINVIEKDLNQLEKRLYDFEQGLKQFEVELKADFYEDSIKEVQEQNIRLKKLESQVQSLNDGINTIQEAIQQAQSGNSIVGNQEDILNLKEMLDKLKEQRNSLEQSKKELIKDGQILTGDLHEVNIENITPSTLEKFDNEIVRLRDVTNNQEKLISDAINEMKKVKDNAQSIAFKKKADKRQECKQKLKKIKDNTDELDRILSEIGSTLDMIWKDALYLKESEFSPVKGRTSVLYGQNGDLEKEQEVIKQYRELETQQAEYNDLKKEKDKLKKLILISQQQYEALPLEASSLTDFEGLIDSLQQDLDEKSSNLKDKGKDLLEVQLKKLKDDVENLIERFKQKKAVLGDCKKEEKDKIAEVQRIESQLNGYKLRIGQMERELINQQSMNFKTNQEKKELSQSLLVDVQNIKAKVMSKNIEVESQKEQVRNTTADLSLMGEKLVTLDALKQIYKQLLELKRLQGLKDELKSLGDQIGVKESQVESFIKDLLGGSLYECERKLKEGEAMVDKMQKKIIELNNGMNDFEIDVKKGLQTNGSNGGEDEEITKEGRRLNEWNYKDRKDLKEVEDQKNLIRKVLQRIKNNLNEQSESKQDGSQGSKLSGSALEELITEIETCMKKGEVHSSDLGALDTNLERRKDEWSKCMFKSGAKDALLEDIERSLKDNIEGLDELETKLKDIEKMLRGFNEVSLAMKDNPDYEMRQGYVQKMIEQNIESKKQKDELEKQKNDLKEQIRRHKEAKAGGFKNLSVQELQDLAKQTEEASDSLIKQNKEADKVLKELMKRRQKLGDADILDNFKNRVESLNELDNKLKDIDRDLKDLEKIIQDAAKLNPKGASEGQQQFQRLNQDLAQQLKDKEQIQKKLVDLREKIKTKDLNREDPFTFTHLIEEIRNLRQQILAADVSANKLVQNMTFQKNKFGGVDVDKKFDQFKQSAEDHRHRLADIMADLEVLKELFDEFDGYTSDAQEEDFIERLGVDLREVITKYAIANEESEQIFDQIRSAKNKIQRNKEGSDLSKVGMNAKDLEERATLISSIEDQSLRTKRMVDDLQSRLTKNKKVFMAMQSKEKLRRRQQEVLELSKRLEQFENQINEIECDMQNEANKIKIGAEGGEYLMQIFEQMFQEINGVKLEYADINQKLMQIEEDINECKNSKMHQFELLKANIHIKKQILKNLQAAKQVRQQYAMLKSKYEQNKPKKQISYKAAKGDYVDQLLADWLNTNSCPVPIKRMGAGYYMFGTKKIYAKIINGKLVIRVGGGYMSIDEFMFYYGAQELNKIIAYEAVDDNDELDLEEALDGNKNQGDLIKHSKEGQSIIGIQQMKKRLSPRQLSPRAGSPNAQNVVKRSAQGAGSPRVTGSPRNVMRTESRGSGADSVNSQQMSGKRSPMQSSFLKKNTQKKQLEQNDDSFQRIQMTIKEKEKHQ